MTVDFLGNKTLMQVHEIEKSTMVQEDLPPSGAREGERKTVWSFKGDWAGRRGTARRVERLGVESFAMRQTSSLAA